MDLRSIHQSDDLEAFNDIICRYGESLTAFVFHILKDMDVADDIVQDLFLSLWTKRGKIDFGEPIKNYLYVTARNLAYYHIRSNKRLDKGVPAAIPSEEQTSAYIIEEEARRILNDAITRLPDRTGEVIRLTLEGLRQEAIAEQMGISLANVKKLKALGIAKLKEMMGPLFFLIFELM